MMTLLAFASHDTVSDELDQKLSHDTPTLHAPVTPTDDAIGGPDDAPVVKVCKSCMKSAPDEATFCPKCGDTLVSIRRTPDPYIEDMVGGRYRIAEKIGQGGMGVVYLALNDELGQKVAVKFLSKKFADDENLVLRFLNEAKSYCRVNHPNAVTLLDYGQHDDAALFIITEFVEGANVTETLQDRGPLPSDIVLDLGIQIAEVLSAAHSQGVIHRDLKPDNIMLMPLARGRYAVKVLDFGIAKIVDEEDGPNTETGSVFGTPEFMAPEQARGDEADPRSDIYALGVILFYMVTGRLPFKGKNKLVVLNMQLNEPAPRPREVFPEADLGPRFESVIMKCLNKGRSQRYDNADDLLEALEDLRVPGGHATGKVGAVRADASANTTEEGWVDVHSHADTLASPLNHKAELAELASIEMWRESDGPANDLPDRAMPVGPIIGFVVLIAAAGIGWSLFAGPSTTQPEKVTLNDTVAASAGDALFATIDLMIDDGNLEGARTAMEYSPADESEQRTVLEQRLSTLEAERSRFDVAVQKKDCDTAGAIAGGVNSAGLAEILREKLKGCGVQVQKPPVEKPPVEKPPVEKPPVEKPPVEKPPVEKPPVEKPPVEKPPVEKPPVEKPDETLPDDMALPPRTLED